MKASGALNDTENIGDDGGIPRRGGETETFYLSALDKAARRLGLDLDEGAKYRLLSYFIELERWNRAYNLVGRRLGTEGITELVVDSITPMSIKGLFANETEVVDIGSGAGMPGIPLYLVGGPFLLTLVESQRKRITFLRHIVRKLGLAEVSVYAGRVENMASEEDKLNAYELALSRAVMEPLRLLKVVRPLLCEGGRVVLFLGSGGTQELKKNALRLEEKGWRLESVKSTQRFTGKDVYLALLRKR